MIGTPEIRYFCIRSSASLIRCVGDSVTGLTIIPLSERLTRSTSEACSSIDRFLWMTPIAPCCAIAMASSDSVTVSIAALASGTLSRMLRENRVDTSTCVGSTCECCGTSSTSSKVRAVAIESARRVKAAGEVSVLSSMIGSASVQRGPTPRHK